MLLLSASSTATAAEPQAERPTCSVARSVDALDADLKRLEDAYGAQDSARVRRASDDVMATVMCLGEVLSPETAARVHRDLGLRAWLDRAVPGTLSSSAYFAASRNLEPRYEFPADVVSPGDAVFREYISVAVGVTPAEPYDPPRGLTATFDGLATGRRPSTWPTIMQLASEVDGRVVWSDYLVPGEVPDTRAFEQQAALRARHRVGLVAGGGGILLAGVGAALVASSTSFIQNHGECFSSGYAYNDNGLCDQPDEVFPDELVRAEFYGGIALAAVGGIGALAGTAMVLVDHDSVMVTLALPL